MSLGCSKMDLICSFDFQQSYIHSKGRMHSSSAENVVNSVGIPRSLVGWDLGVGSFGEVDWLDILKVVSCAVYQCSNQIK